MRTIPTIEPHSVVAGDTLTWQKSLPDFPASAGWVLSYHLTSTAGAYSFTATAAGDDHLVTVPSVTSASYVPARYGWTASVAKSGERYTVGTGYLTIKPNPDTVGATDIRSHAKRVLDAIEAILEGTASTSDHEIDVDGTKLVRRTVKELLDLRIRYLKEYRAEQLLARKPGAFGRTLKMRR